MKERDANQKSAEKSARRDGLLQEHLGPIGVGAGLALLVFTLPLIGAGLSLIATEEPLGLTVRVFLFLFGLVFALMGATLFAAGFLMLVNENVPGDSFFVLRAFRYLLRQLFRPLHLVAAVPVALVLAQYALVQRSGEGLFGVDAELLRSGMMLELIAIHATGFLGMATLLPSAGRWRWARPVILVGLLLAYVALVSGEGRDAAIFFTYLMAIKLGPFLLAPPDLHTGTTLGLRWCFQVLLLGAAVTWFGGPRDLRAGTLYWALILFTEMFGMMNAELFERPESGVVG